MGNEIVDVQHVTTTKRDYADLRERLGPWLVERLPGLEPVIADMTVPEKNGMSSETILLDVTTNDGKTVGYVVRMAPLDNAVPVFRTYDFALQFKVMQVVAERSDVPVPAALWLELDESVAGSQFFVMERIDGIVPPDVMPYPFGDNWLFDASPDDQRRLQDASVRAMAGIHQIELTDDEIEYFDVKGSGDTALRRHFEDQKAFHSWIADGELYPVITNAMNWLEANWPEDDTRAVLNWGDGRVGNVMYRDFQPVAVVDWEMACIAPAEVDLGWMIYLHMFFQDLVETLEMEGMPDFMRVEDVCATYEAATGYAPKDIRWYITYAAVRHGIVMARVTRRSIAFGEDTEREDPDDMIMHRASLDAMVDGSYWNTKS